MLARLACFSCSLCACERVRVFIGSTETMASSSDKAMASSSDTTMASSSDKAMASSSDKAMSSSSDFDNLDIPEELVDVIVRFHQDFQKVVEIFEPLRDVRIFSPDTKMDPLDRATLGVLCGVALNSLFKMYLRTLGLGTDPKEYKFKEIMERYKTFHSEIQEIRKKRNAADKDKVARLNKDSAERSTDSDLSILEDSNAPVTGAASSSSSSSMKKNKKKRQKKTRDEEDLEVVGFKYGIVTDEDAALNLKMKKTAEESEIVYLSECIGSKDKKEVILVE